MHPELMHLAAQARFEDLRREADDRRRTERRAGLWRRLRSRTPSIEPASSPTVDVAPAAAVPVQVRREVPDLATQDQRRS